MSETLVNSPRKIIDKLYRLFKFLLSNLLAFTVPPRTLLQEVSDYRHHKANQNRLWYLHGLTPRQHGNFSCR